MSDPVLSTCHRCGQDRFCADEHPEICCECMDTIGGYAAYKREWATPDPVNHPPHYNTGKIEVIAVIEDWNLGFHDGNAVKYIARAAHKGNQIQDLEKARWYLDRLIANLSAGTQARAVTNRRKPNEDIS